MTGTETAAETVQPEQTTVDQLRPDTTNHNLLVKVRLLIGILWYSWRKARYKTVSKRFWPKCETACDWVGSDAVGC
jgi:hypothetical protein